MLAIIVIIIIYSMINRWKLSFVEKLKDEDGEWKIEQRDLSLDTAITKMKLFWCLRWKNTVIYTYIG